MVQLKVPEQADFQIYLLHHFNSTMVKLKACGLLTLALPTFGERLKAWII
jgi:hypothetical protein